MPEAAAPLFELTEAQSPLNGLLSTPDLARDDEVRAVAEWFCTALPHRVPPYAQRNWGGTLHSLCSYQGKLKPALAHFLVAAFSRPGDVVLDPMSGVATVPLEARLQGRRAVAGDLSELAVAVSRAKLERFAETSVHKVVADLAKHLELEAPETRALVEREHADFGLNGKVEEYFHERTLREVLLAREFFRQRGADDPAHAVVLTALLHVLHGNRPYAISRRSHPVTPLKPQGPSEYRPVVAHIERRLERVLPLLSQLPGAGQALRASYEDLALGSASVDAVITSPPFAESLRFFSSNWLRLWFCGWQPSDFRLPSDAFLERRQRLAFEDAYRQFLAAMAAHLCPGGLLVMHLGETRKLDMAARIAPLLEPNYALIYAGRECVADTESHGLTDKGATRAHGFLFCRRLD